MADASLPPMHGTSFVLDLAVQGGFAPRPRARSASYNTMCGRRGSSTASPSSYTASPSLYPYTHTGRDHTGTRE
eukprot:2812129-Prymnesium_polylepis.1